jgi:hypothetical protein
MLLLHPQVLSGAILLRAMVPLLAAPQGDLTAKPVLIISGAQDPIVPPRTRQGSRSCCVHRAAVEHRVLRACRTLTLQWLGSGCERPLQRTTRPRWTALRISRCHATVKQKGCMRRADHRQGQPELVDPEPAMSDPGFANCVAAAIGEAPGLRQRSTPY